MKPRSSTYTPARLKECLALNKLRENQLTLELPLFLAAVSLDYGVNDSVITAVTRFMSLLNGNYDILYKVYEVSDEKDSEEKEYDGYTIATQAASSLNFQALDTLIRELPPSEHKTFANYAATKGQWIGFQPIHFSAMWGLLDKLTLLHKCGADLAAQLPIDSEEKTLGKCGGWNILDIAIKKWTLNKDEHETIRAASIEIMQYFILFISKKKTVTDILQDVKNKHTYLNKDESAAINEIISATCKVKSARLVPDSKRRSKRERTDSADSKKQEPQMKKPKSSHAAMSLALSAANEEEKKEAPIEKIDPKRIVQLEEQNASLQSKLTFFQLEFEKLRSDLTLQTEQARSLKAVLDESQTKMEGVQTEQKQMQSSHQTLTEKVESSLSQHTFLHSEFANSRLEFTKQAEQVHSLEIALGEHQAREEGSLGQYTCLQSEFAKHVEQTRSLGVALYESQVRVDEIQAEQKDMQAFNMTFVTEVNSSLNQLASSLTVCAQHVEQIPPFQDAFNKSQASMGDYSKQIESCFLAQLQSQQTLGNKIEDIKNSHQKLTEKVESYHRASSQRMDLVLTPHSFLAQSFERLEEKKSAAQPPQRSESPGSYFLLP